MLHRNDDVRALALKAAGAKDIDLGYALDQIAGWQTARRKLPQWAATEGIKYPPHLSMEQCSSEQTAIYKADVAQRLVSGLPRDEESVLVDLTGDWASTSLTWRAASAVASTLSARAICASSRGITWACWASVRPRWSAPILSNLWAKWGMLR